MLGHRKLEVTDYLAILRRRAWVIAIPLIVFPILAVVVTHLVQPRFLSQTLVLIDQQKIPDEYVKSVVSSDLDTRLASMKEQILSRSRLQPIIERYNLYSSQHISVDDKVEIARKNISIKAIHSEISGAGGLPGFFISFTASNPRIAQAVCGEITSLFVNEDLRSREASAEGTTDFLKSQLDDAKRSLDEQDAKLAAFQSRYVGKLPGEESSNVDMLTSLNTQLEAATESLSRMEQDRAYTQSLLAQIAPSSSGGVSAGSVTIPNPQKQARQAELRTLETQEADLTVTYTPDYPDVVAIRNKIADLHKQITQMPDMVASTEPRGSGPQADSASVLQLRAQLRAADSGIQAKRNEQNMLEAQVRSYQDRIASSPLVDEQYKQLTRDSDTAKGFYDDLLSKMNQSEMATDLERRQEGEQFHIMDQPNLPDAPIFPNRALFLAGGVFLGLTVGLLLSALLEYRDTSLRNERDVWTFTKLPTLSVIEFIEDDAEPTPRQKQRWLSSRKKVSKELISNTH